MCMARVHRLMRAWHVRGVCACRCLRGLEHACASVCILSCVWRVRMQVLAGEGLQTASLGAAAATDADALVRARSAHAHTRTRCSHPSLRSHPRLYLGCFLLHLGCISAVQVDMTKPSKKAVAAILRSPPKLEVKLSLSP